MPTSLYGPYSDSEVRQILEVYENVAGFCSPDVCFQDARKYIPDLSVSWVEIEPASKGRNDPASGARIRSHEKRGIFLSNKPDINELVRACLEEKCRLTQILVAGSFRPLLAGL